MALFDRLIADDGVAKVVDLGHESFAPFFALASQIGLVEEASNHGIVTAILFLLTPDASSVEAYGSLRKRFRRAMFVPVQNEILGPAQHRGRYPIGPGALTVRLPLLAPGFATAYRAAAIFICRRRARRQQRHSDGRHKSSCSTGSAA